ncbi:DUF2946 family protein [Paraburkholderia caballeronis]|uniref:DUF2946 family protein n=1 Tax=Paraburkholderia caballeronis TaxID=416943 RepID=A0A1H7PUQ2_9BURK|nr:DUF2946 family protein [Paraburkholderia caballeronis]PXW24326.1 hypothetical protein C7403_107142 [Paraburkholderia caballeronis]PXX00108.1 hypothetical protein C7407_107142 [Paraburkholderia caballeronis]RAJ97237.1 hypothetical protein C7409_107142 [Paraburkholderia caballeronis]SEB68066.1 Protein of unknown function [Paraburkholderia caballeronis]SEL38777.1 Protein of unknown function [Paraburkholderia caballeronis]
MDEIVKQALARWPNVPHCTGWLRLDARGNWRMRDEAAQAQRAPGTPIRHAALLGFINRNYECDDDGQWFFQNGPQRVYVELEYTPWVVRLSRDDGGLPVFTDQTGQPFVPAAAFVDDAGSVLFADGSTPERIAVLHDHDLGLFSEHAELADDGSGGTFHWREDVALSLQPVLRDEVAKRFGFVASPADAAQHG